MKKVNAFTLVELIIVMIISIITLSTIYTVYLLVKKQYLVQSVKAESLDHYLLFKNAFSSDFNNADSVSHTDENRLLLHIDTTVVTYEFLEKAVIREQNNFTDSFYVFPENLQTGVAENTELVNQVSFNIVPYSDTVRLLFRKDYDAASLIKTKLK